MGGTRGMEGGPLEVRSDLELHPSCVEGEAAAVLHMLLEGDLGAGVAGEEGERHSVHIPRNQRRGQGEEVHPRGEDARDDEGEAEELCDVHLAWSEN